MGKRGNDGSMKRKTCSHGRRGRNHGLRRSSVRRGGRQAPNRLNPRVQKVQTNPDYWWEKIRQTNKKDAENLFSTKKFVTKEQRET